MVAAGWSEAQKRAYVLADNQLAITGSGWDPELLRLELGELNSAGAPVPIDRADERRLSRLSEGSHKAARLWRTRCGFEPPVANDPRCESQGPLGASGLRSIRNQQAGLSG
jgi:hypothetical protein